MKGLARSLTRGRDELESFYARSLSLSLSLNFGTSERKIRAETPPSSLLFLRFGFNFSALIEYCGFHGRYACDFFQLAWLIELGEGSTGFGFLKVLGT